MRRDPDVARLFGVLRPPPPLRTQFVICFPFETRVPFTEVFCMHELKHKTPFLSGTICLRGDGTRRRLLLWESSGPLVRLLEHAPRPRCHPLRRGFLSHAGYGVSSLRQDVEELDELLYFLSSSTSQERALASSTAECVVNGGGGWASRISDQNSFYRYVCMRWSFTSGRFVRSRWEGALCACMYLTL